MGKGNKINIELNDNRNIFQNTSQDYIVTTKDKLELVLLKTKKCLASKDSWQTPLGLFISCLLTLLTTNFKDFFLPANVWAAIFVIATVFCFIWLVKTLYNLYINRNKGDIEYIIKKIIKESTETE